MRSKSRLAFVLAIFAGLALACSASRAASTIEAVKGKHYKLTKRHGPWMIMVASFITPPADRRGEGMSPDQAADELVYELRLHHIPAYTFRQEEVDEEVQVVGRRTMTAQKAKVRNWTGGICVLAGNYASSNDKVAATDLGLHQDKIRAGIPQRRRGRSASHLPARRSNAPRVAASSAPRKIVPAR